MESRKNSHNMTEQEKKKKIRELAAEILPEFTLTFSKKNSVKGLIVKKNIEKINQVIKRLESDVVDFTIKKSRKGSDVDMLMCLTYALARHPNKEFTLEQIAAAMGRHHTSLLYHIGVIKTLSKINANMRGMNGTIPEFINKINDIINSELYEKNNINI